MERMIGEMKIDISDNTCRITEPGMEFIDGQMEYFMDSGKRIIIMIMDIGRLSMAQNFMDSGRMVN